MDILNEVLEFVNKQVDFHKSKADEFAPSNSRRAQHHTKTAESMADVANLLTKQATDIKVLGEELMKRPPAQDRSKRPLQLRIEDLEDLPDELVQELSITDGDRLDFTIYTIIEELGGIASLDQLLIALYRKTGEVHKRSNINSRLYRLTTRGGDLFNVPGKKGVYATHELSEEETNDLG